MFRRNPRVGHEGAAMAIHKRTACLVALTCMLGFAPRPLVAQKFRVQIHSAPRAPESPGRAARNSLPRPTVVTVGLNAYVEGVLAGEAAIMKNRAALQAMAILARTWALGHRGRHRAQGFDFCSLTHCQVFRLPPGGVHGRYPPAIVDVAISTRGIVLLYRGRLADPYFTADCGGVTESAANLWPDRILPYLVSVRDP